MKFNKLVPELTVLDFEKSLDFYTNIIGFRLEYSRQAPKFALLSFQGSQIMIEDLKGNRDPIWRTGKLEQPYGRGINFQIEVSDVQALLEALQKSGYPIRMMPRDNWYRKDNTLFGCREILVLDPDGYLLRFSQDLGTRKV